MKRQLETGTSNTKELSKLQKKMAKDIAGGKFRFLNEELYTSNSQTSMKMFEDDAEMFKVYHDGFRSQVESWPSNPVDIFIGDLRKAFKKSAEMVVLDLGCGEAKIAETFPEKNISSYDFVAVNSRVTKCDIAKLPQGPKSVDVAIFCLSLMGTNYKDFLVEANRVLKMDGKLWIAEVVSRLENASAFVDFLGTIGFRLDRKEDGNKMFTLLYLTKIANCSGKIAGAKKEDSLLKPCHYKKR